MGSFYRAPIVLGSLATTVTASGYPAESAFLGLGPKTRLELYHPPSQTPARLRPPPLDSRAQASKPLLRTAGLGPNCRKRLPAEPQSPAKLPQFPCCPPGSRRPRPAWSVPAPGQDARD